MSYTSTTLVINELGTNYDNADDLTTAHITAFIAKADSEINDAAYQFFNPFNAYDSLLTDTTDVYTTPGVIAECSKNLTVARSLGQLRAKKGNTSHSDTIEWYWGLGQETLAALRGGMFLAPSTWRSFSLTFGDSDPGFELDSNQSFVNPSALDSGDPVHILADTVQVASATGITNPAQLRLGPDYTVKWSKEWRNWVFTRKESNLVAASAVALTFKWDYRKDYADEPHGVTHIYAG